MVGDCRQVLHLHDLLWMHQMLPGVLSSCCNFLYWNLAIWPLNSFHGCLAVPIFLTSLRSCSCDSFSCPGPFKWLLLSQLWHAESLIVTIVTRRVTLLATVPSAKENWWPWWDTGVRVRKIGDDQASMWNCWRDQIVKFHLDKRYEVAFDAITEDHREIVLKSLTLKSLTTIRTGLVISKFSSLIEYKRSKVISIVNNALLQITHIEEATCICSRFFMC